MSTQLVNIEEQNVLEVFSTQGGLGPVIEEIKSIVSEFEHDLTTATGRKRTASLAAQVARSKTYLDGLGKDLTAEWKAKSKLVDAERKSARDELDALKVIARKPLTDWENEQAEIEAQKAAKIEAEKIASEIESDQEIALLMYSNHLRELEEKAQKAAEEKAAYEQKLKDEAAAKAKAEAERLAAEQLAAAEREKILAEQAKADAVKREQEAKQAVIDAEKRAEQDRIAAVEREKQAKIDAENQAKQAAEKARLEELQRALDEKARLDEEAKAREKNKAHKAKINNEVLDCLVSGGLDIDSAKLAIKLIASGRVLNATIRY